MHSVTFRALKVRTANLQTGWLFYVDSKSVGCTFQWEQLQRTEWPEDDLHPSNVGKASGVYVWAFVLAETCIDEYLQQSETQVSALALHCCQGLL